MHENIRYDANARNLFNLCVATHERKYRTRIIVRLHQRVSLIDPLHYTTPVATLIVKGNNERTNVDVRRYPLRRLISPSN